MQPTPHLYLIGIGGVGMVWIADYALSQGWKVSGSDLIESAQVKRLQSAGAVIHIGSNPDAIPQDITECVITSAITQSAPAYPELQRIEAMDVPVVKRAGWVGRLTKQKFTIAVCGAHGKTTTTAMIGWILAEAGYDPTVFVGTNMPAWGDATRIGKSEFLVLEADEYDRSFHQFYPQVAVVLNIDKDHTDYYTGGLPEIESSYRRFLRNLPSKVHATPRGPGVVIGYGRDGRVRKVSRGFKYSFRWYDEDHLYAGAQVPQPGLIYRLNATAAAKAAHEIGVPHEVIKAALSTFPGSGRRFEYLGRWNGVELYDDYGHHPTEVAATLAAMREKWVQGSTPITLVYQPHQKARTKSLLKEFGTCFDAAAPDRLILAPIYFVAGREDDIEISSHDVASSIAERGKADMKVEVASDESELEKLVREASQGEGVMVVMGAGSIRALIDRWRTS